MARTHHDPRGYSSHSGFSKTQIVVMLLFLTCTVLSLSFMKSIEELTMASRLIIAFLSMCSIGYFIWMIESVCRKRNKN